MSCSLTTRGLLCMSSPLLITTFLPCSGKHLPLRLTVTSCAKSSLNPRADLHSCSSESPVSLTWPHHSTPDTPLHVPGPCLPPKSGQGLLHGQALPLVYPRSPAAVPAHGRCSVCVWAGRGGSECVCYIIFVLNCSGVGLMRPHDLVLDQETR